MNSHSDEIARVLRLDHYLGELLLIVEVVGGAGGFIVMFTSLFASVVRKQRVFGTLQLLGQRRSSLVLFPVFQSLAVALAGGGQALLLFWGASNFANAHLGNELGDSARYCVFDWAHILPVLCGGLTLSLVAACLAAFRILKIQPSEALRDE